MKIIVEHIIEKIVEKVIVPKFIEKILPGGRQFQMLGRHSEGASPAPAEDIEEVEEYYEVEQEEMAWEARRPNSSMKLKRQYISEEYAVKMTLVQSILDNFGSTFWTKRDNAFRKRWTFVQLWANPPWSTRQGCSQAYL